MYKHNKQITTGGRSPGEADKAIILLHGRGATAASVLSLGKHLPLEDMTIYAPQAANNSWYPYSFMAPVAQNQPALDSALELLDDLVDEIYTGGIQPENLYFAGFSQGACLTLEFTARHAVRYGGIIAFTGGLIGATLQRELYTGDFKGTSLLITTSNPDTHVPLQRVEESVSVLQELHAGVQLKVYEGKPHNITPDEIAQARKVIFKSSM